MNHQLSNTHIEFYQKNGYLIVDNFLDDRELAIWREAVDEAVAARKNNRLPYNVLLIFLISYHLFQVLYLLH